MDFLPPDIHRYAEQHTTPENETLKKINRQTHAQVMMPRMLSGHLQGTFLSMISHMIRPSSILEIGTYTGYSALCLAEGLKDDGKLYTIDINEELEEKVRASFAERGFADKITYLIGDARKMIQRVPGNFDLVFIDADKENYA